VSLVLDCLARLVKAVMCVGVIDHVELSPCDDEIGASKTIKTEHNLAHRWITTCSKLKGRGSASNRGQRLSAKTRRAPVLENELRPGGHAHLFPKTGVST